MQKTCMILALAAGLVACGPPADERKKTAEEAATLRANQFCDSPGGLDEYDTRLRYLHEQLTEQGVTDDSEVDAAIKLFDEKIKASCPGKMPR